MKKILFISRIVLIIGLLGWGVNELFLPFPDWLVRVDGIFMMVGMTVVTYSTVRIKMSKDGV